MYGGALNSASVIGRYGNAYGDYIAAFGLPVQKDVLDRIPVTGNTSISAPVPSGYGSSIPVSMTLSGPTIHDVSKFLKADAPHASQAQPASRAKHSEGPVVPHTPPRSGHQQRSTLRKPTQGQNLTVKSQRTEAEEEAFKDILSAVADVLPIGLGLIGGGPIGALAGFALHAASRIAAETVNAESEMDGPATRITKAETVNTESNEGSMERAILAEATLSALESAKLSPALKESIFSDMRDTVMKALPVIRKAAPRVIGAMMEPALKIAFDSLHKHNQKVAAGAESFEATKSEPFRPTVVYSSDIDQPANHQVEAFLDHLQASLQHNPQESAMDGESEEAFIDIIKAGAHYAGKGVLAAVKHGLPILVDLMKQSGGAESFEDQPGSNAASHVFNADTLAQRALVADAALKSVMTIPPSQLQEEGIFDFIADAVKIIAPIAMKVAPVVAGAISPTIGKIVNNVLNQESTFAGNSDKLRGPLVRRTVTQGLSSKRSLQTLRDDSAHDNERRNRIEQPGTNRFQDGSYSRLGSRLAY